MSHITFSFIIPAYNEEKYLPGCLDSIAHVDYDVNCFEIIVVDNGSEDKTREIASSFNATVICDRTKTVAGLRNLGAQNAQGDILVFVDADCLVERELLKNAEKYIARTGVAAWGAPPIISPDSTWVQRAWFIVRKKELPIQEVDWLESMNLFVRRKDFLKLGGFNESLETCEDVDFSYRIAEQGKILSDESLVVIHLGEANTLRDFIKKELWRGKSTYQGIKSHRISVKELPSLAIPIYFCFIYPFSLIGLLTISPDIWLSVSVALFFFPGLAALTKLGRRIPDSLTAFQLLLLLQTYFLTRTASVVRNWVDTWLFEEGPPTKVPNK